MGCTVVVGADVAESAWGTSAWRMGLEPLSLFMGSVGLAVVPRGPAMLSGLPPLEICRQGLGHPLRLGGCSCR